MGTRNVLLAGELKARPLWVALGWGLILLVVYLSLTPTPVDLPLEKGDKLSHVLAYLVLMWWFANLYPSAHHRICWAAGFVLLGIVLEFLQRWTGYRSFELADMVAGTLGVALGWILAPPRLPFYLGFAEKFWCKE